MVMMQREGAMNMRESEYVPKVRNFKLNHTSFKADALVKHIQTHIKTLFCQDSNFFFKATQTPSVLYRVTVWSTTKTDPHSCLYNILVQLLIRTGITVPFL